MGKVKNKQSPQADSSFRNVIMNPSFMSKNKKRKEKRLAKSLIEEKSKTGEFISVNNSSLLSSSKLKNAKKENDSVQGKEKESFLSTSLPVKSNKKEKDGVANQSFASVNSNAKFKKQIVGSTNSPKVYNQKKTENVKQKSVPESDKTTVNYKNKKGMKGEELLKPDEKKNIKALKRPAEDSTDDESDNDSFEENDFVDFEASEDEGEESEDGSNEQDSEDDDDNDESLDTDSFFNNNEESDDDDDDDDDSEEEPEPHTKGQKHNLSISIKSDLVTSVKVKSEPKMSVDDEVQELPSKMQKKKALTTKKTETVTGKEIKKKLNTPLKSVLKNANKETSTPKVKVESGTKTKTNNSEKKEENVKSGSGDDKRSVGFIRHIPENVKEADIKNAIVKVMKKNVVDQVVLKKPRKNKKISNAYVHMQNFDALESILNKKFRAGDFEFSVYKAKHEVVLKPVAFIPRVPLSIKTDSIRKAIEADIGSGHVTQLQEMRVLEKSQSRNILIYFDDIEVAKKAILTGDYKINDQSVIVREAREAGIEIPIFRVVISNIPESATETDLKKTLESNIGKDSVQNVSFSFKKKSFAFVVLATEEARQKALALNDELSYKNVNLKIIEYIPRKPFKRGPISATAKQKRAQKKKNKKKSNENESKPPSPKKMKVDNSNQKSNERDKTPPSLKKKKNQNQSVSKMKSPQTGEVKAKKNPKVEGKKEKTKNPSSVVPNKASPLKKKIKEKIKQKKQKPKKGE